MEFIVSAPGPGKIMKTIEMSWGEMAYHDSGNQLLSLIFLHGTGCDASDWGPVIDGLPRDRRFIALDFRGHGQSTVPTQPFTLADLAEDVLYLSDNLATSRVGNRRA